MSKERPNFRIIENYEPNIDMDEFREDYLDENMNIDDICRKYDISRKRFYTYRKEIMGDVGVKTKPNKDRYANCKNKHRYIHQRRNAYSISKILDKTSVYFGQYKTLDEAIKIRDLLIEHDWDYDYYLREIRPLYSSSVDFSIPDGFEDDFLNGMSVGDMRDKYNMSLYQYYNIATLVKLKYGLNRKPMKVRA